MKAIILKSFGGADQLEYRDIPVPRINDNQVLIRTHAISINPVDIKTRNGKGQAARLKNEDPMILGWDISGVITATGANVTSFIEGDEVFGMINLPGAGRGYAEYVAAPVDHLAIKPDHLSHQAAAAACLAAMTAWQALVYQAKIYKGAKLLIHAAAGGVGHYAIQIAKYLGAYVIGTASAENRDLILSLGADDHIDYHSVPFEEVAPEVDFILDAIGGDNIERSLRVLKPGGTIISLPSGVSESVTEKAAAQGKNGIFFFVQSNGKDMQQIATLLRNGIIRSHVSKTFAFTEIKAAHQQLETGNTKGKVVLLAP